jgi:hypothetical protein
MAPLCFLSISIRHASLELSSADARMEEYDDGLDLANIAAAQDLSRQHYQRGCVPIR